MTEIHLTKLFILSTLSLLVIISLAPSPALSKGHHGGTHKYSCPVLRKCRTIPNEHSHKICGSDGQFYDSTCHLRKSGCEKGIHLKPVHPDQCIKEEDEVDNDEEDIGVAGTEDEYIHGKEDGVQNDPTFAARYQEKEDRNGIQSADLPVTSLSSNSKDVNDLKDDLDSNDDDDDDINEDNEKKKKRRIKSDGNMDEGEDEAGNEDEEVDIDDENDQDRKKEKKGRKDQFSTKMVSRSSESVSCSPTNYDLMKEQIQAKWTDISLLFSDVDENTDGTININELWQKSGIYKISNSPCLITDLLLHEDKNEDDLLDFTEFQNAFSNLYTITMVTLDPSVAVSHINAHVGDNVEIRCDIVGKPQPPVIQWFRHNVNLATLNLPNLKVFADGSLYLTGVQVSFTGNYTCQAETNSAVKQTHILHVIVGPVVEITPEFQWLREGDSASIDCQYESLIDDINIKWFKNDQEISLADVHGKTSLLNNGSKLQLSDVTRSDTGAYTCQVYHANTDDGEVSSGEDVSSLLVQDEPVVPSPRIEREKLWLFHGNGVTIYNQGCHGIIHELDSRDVIPFNGLPLCSRTNSENSKSGPRLCEWGPRAIQLGQLIYITQPNLNRIIAFHTKQLVVVQVIATDPQPRELWLTKNNDEDRIWVLCHGQPIKGDNSKKHRDFESRKGHEMIGSFETLDMNWNSPSREQQLHNKKTIQILRFNSKNQNEHNLIHLQPIDGHFDLVYDLFIPLHSNGLLDSVLKSSPSNNQFAYVTHWDERALVKIDMDKFQYIKKINLAECQPINAVFTFYGLVILQCQTPVTHKLNGQLILDQMTDAIISFNPHIRGSKNYLSPDHKFLITVSNNESSENLVPSTTIIVQKVNKDGVTFMYDVRTTLNIVSCEFVWRSGSYDSLLGSGTSNREDLLYLSLVDGRVELVSGIGKPTAGSRRGLSISSKSSLAGVTSLESVFVVDLKKKSVECEAPRKHQNPSTLFWS